MADFVLLHGTTQSARGWDRLMAALETHGHNAHAVTLSNDPDLDIDGHTAAVTAQLPSTLNAPVVVAHSGGGLLLPAVASALDAARQTWIAAFIPDGQHTLLEEVTALPADIFNPEWTSQNLTVDHVAATYFLFHDCDYLSLRWALTTLETFFPSRLYNCAIPLAPDIPSTYIVCNHDRTIRPDWGRQQARQRLAADLVEIDTGHCPHVSRPELLATILTATAN